MMLNELTLGEICDQGGGIIRTGPFGSQLHESDYSEIGTPVVMPKDIIEGKVAESTIARVSQEHVDRLGQHRLVPGDIVYGRRGDIGRQALITQRESGWLCGTGCLRITPGKSVVDSKWLHYYLRDSQVIAFIAQQAVGATMPNLNTSILRSIPIRFPALAIQRRIASVLSAYDDLIENNTRRIAILEEMARRIYEEWFVRFRFPGHEEVKMVESELGLIPEGWRRGSISELYEGLYDGPHATPKPSTGGPVFLGIGNLTETGRMDFSSVRHIAEEDFGKWTKRVCPQPGDIVFTYEATLNRYALIPNGFRGCLGRRLALIRTNPETHSNLYLFCMFFSEGWRQVVAQNTLSGATVDRIPLSKFPSFPIMVPSMPIMAVFDGIVRPMFAEIEVLGRKSKNLRATRDLLLPKLISGELDVSTLPEPEEALAA